HDLDAADVVGAEEPIAERGAGRGHAQRSQSPAPWGRAPGDATLRAADGADGRGSPRGAPPRSMLEVYPGRMALGRRWAPAIALDACFRRLPLPVRSRTSVSDAGAGAVDAGASSPPGGSLGAIRVVRMVRSYFGYELLPVHSFAVGDTLVDTGL